MSVTYLDSDVVSIRLRKRPELEILIDREDAPRVLKHTWRVVERKRSLTLYVAGKVAGKEVYLHRFIMRASPGEEVNHTTGSGLDNRKSKLEFTTRSGNMLHAYSLPGRYTVPAAHTNKVRKRLASGAVKIYVYDRQSGALLDSYKENKMAQNPA